MVTIMVYKLPIMSIETDCQNIFIVITIKALQTKPKPAVLRWKAVFFKQKGHGGQLP